MQREALALDEVDAAVGEISRVARRFLFLKISNRKDATGLQLPRLARSGVSVPATLHLTVKPIEFWVERFERKGFSLHHALEDTPSFGWLRQQRHMCCSIVLMRTGSPRLPAGVADRSLRWLQQQWRLDSEGQLARGAMHN